MAASGLFGDLDMSQVMMGNRAFQVGLNLIVQHVDGKGAVSGVFQSSQGLPLFFGSPRTHVLILGDAILRPHMAFGSDAFKGHGLSGLATGAFGDVDTWTQGDVLVAPLEGDTLQKRKRR